MKVMIVTDAWRPQVNGVVRTLSITRRELEAMGHEVVILSPLEFSTLPCPTYPDIRLSILPGSAVARRIREYGPHALHIANEGPLGLAARRYAIRNGLAFTTAYHTRFPEYVKARFGVPLSWTYRFLRWFHAPALRGDGTDTKGKSRPRGLGLCWSSAAAAGSTRWPGARPGRPA